MNTIKHTPPHLVSAAVTSLLDIARDLMTQRHPDIEELLTVLANLPVDDLDVQTRGAVQHARMVATAGQGRNDGQTAVARFALARVIVLIEQHVAVSRTA